MSKSKAKGTKWETAIRQYLTEEGFEGVERRALAGQSDRGDLGGIPGWVIEAKNCRQMTLSAWVDEAAIEQANDGADYSAVWHHRVGKAHPSSGYVTMTGATFVRILRAVARDRAEGMREEAPLDGPLVGGRGGPEVPPGDSLGEQRHDPDGCHAEGRPHLGPCVDTDAALHRSFYASESYKDR